jgi:cytochrome c556
VAPNAAANLAALSHMNTGALWPAGSDNGALGDKTAALPAIWETYPAVTDKAKALSDASTELAAVAGDGLDAMKAGLGNVGKSCGGCHDDFRQKQ